VIDRVAAIVRADFLIRFRRASTIVVFLLLSAVAYLWVPNPSTGRALMHIGNSRAVYNSAAIGIATAMLASLFVGLVGFYVTSNAVRRDAQSRCGEVLAATPMTKFEYVAGKFAGNTLFLATFTIGFMLTSMAMVVVRGEAPLQPLVFIEQYLIVMPSVIVFVSMLAITFESIPLLEGRFGDVAYFFIWAMTYSVVVAALVQHVRWPLFFDVTGFGSVIDGMQRVLRTSSISIGSSPFKPGVPPVVFRGLPIDGAFVAQRITATLISLPLAAIATLTFHRFDPTRVHVPRNRGPRGPRGTGVRAALAAPLRAFVPGNALAADVLLTFVMQPLIAIVVIAFAIAGLAAPARDVMPIACAAAAIAIADVACRDDRAGTLPLIHSAPKLQARFVAWKFASSFIVALLVTIVPLVRSGAPLAGIVGIALIASAATSLAIISGNAKTFIVLFLSFWYVALNDAGRTAALDFTGVYGRATPMVTLTYFAIAAMLLMAAFSRHR
jgi:ABC-type transport system involved in multi-copper enzyme maturation permease subunit